MNKKLKIAVYKKIVSSFTLIAAALSATCAHAQYKPAEFGDAVEQLAGIVGLPVDLSNRKSTISVYCQADIPISGALTNSLCFESSGSFLERQTVKALQEITFIPAENDGRAVPVRMQFRVIYSGSDDQPDIVLLPNLGTLQSQSGYDYFAPQERLYHSTWYESYRATNGPGKVSFDTGRLTRVLATVKVDGSVESVSTLDARGSARRDAAIVEKTLQASAFIPGFVKGQAVEMHYVAVLNYQK